MKRLFTLFFVVSVLSVCAWADTSVAETFGDIREVAATSGTYNLHFCTWQTSDVRKNGENEEKGEDYIYTSSDASKAHTDCLWLRRSNVSNPGSYVQTTDLTGGIKAINILMAKYANEEGCTFKLNVALGGSSSDVTITTHRNAGGYTWKNTTAAVKEDAQIVIQNVSTGGSQARRILVGTVTLTPYLMYTQKVASIDLGGGTYTHPIINNTEGETGTLTFESSVPGVATVTNAGVVTPVAVGSTVITATYTWDASHHVTASYTLYVSHTINETFSNVEATTATTASGALWIGDENINWQAVLARRGSDDKIGTNQCSWLGTTANQASLTTTNLEGGIKSVYFPYAQFSGEASNYLKLEARALNGEGETITNLEKTRGKGSNCANNKATGLSFYWDSNCKSDAQLQVINTSVNRSDNGNPSSIARWLVGDITITPYIYYTTKKANIEVGSSTYENTDLIKNIDGEGGTLLFSSEHTDIATVNETTGVVTGVAVGCTEIIAKYTWPESSGEVTTRYTVTVNQPITETFADAETFPDADVPKTTAQETNGSLGVWEYYRIRRDADSDKLKSGVQGWWTSGSSSLSGNFLRTKETLEGGVKALSFDWMQYGNAKGAHVMIKVTVGDESPVNMVDYSVAVDGTNDETDKVASKMDWNVKKNAQISFSNISTTTTDKQGRVVIGQIYVSPYIYYTRKKACIAVNGAKYTNDGIINNTCGEDGELSFRSMNTSIATVNSSTGEVTPVASGVTTIEAKYDWGGDNYVTTTYELHVVNSLSWTEDYSNFPSRGMQEEKRIDPGVYLDWYYRFARSNPSKDIIDGKRGVWTNHYNRNTEDNKATYLGCETEGGIKHVYFQWRQYTKDDNGDQLYLTINAGSVEKYSIKPEKKNDNTYVNNLQTVDEEFEIKENVDFRIFNISTTDRDITSNKDIGRIIIGPITITPYLFYLKREKAIGIGERYTHPLLDNTDGEGTISYSLIDSSEEGVASIDAKTGVVTGIKTGYVTVKALWSEGAYTTYKLYVATDLVDGDDNTEVVSPLNGQTVSVRLKDRTIYCDGDFNTICLPFALSKEQLAESPLAGFKIMDFTNAYLSGSGDAQQLDVRFTETDHIVAGRPYLISKSAASDITNPVFENVLISNVEGATVEGTSLNFVGILKPTALNANNLFVGAENTLYWWLDGAENSSLKSYRAYFAVPSDMDEPALAQLRRVSARIVTGKDVVTDVDEIESQTSIVESRKTIENGQIFIIRDDVKYTIMGQIVK